MADPVSLSATVIATLAFTKMLQDNSRMTQSNYDNARGWQTKVDGGTAYIGEVHFNHPPT